MDTPQRSLTPVRHPRRATGLGALLVGIMLTLAMLPAAASASSPGRTLGVYAGSGSPASVAKFEGEVGRPVSVVYDAFAPESWSSMTDVNWWMQTWSASKYSGRVVYSVPMLPNSGGTLAQGAAGDYNGYFRTLAQRLVAGGSGGATLRLGWEFNGDWMKWTINVPNGAANYAAYWRQIVNTMRSVPGAHFKFDWCPNAGSTWVGGKQLQAEAAYPGDAYVDYIGLDVYDASWIPNYNDAAARWKDYLSTGNGLRWHRDFAAKHGKPMTFPEWGLSNRYADDHGGGDAPYFIEQMHAWIKANNVAYHMYFEHADPDGDSAIFAGKTPKAAARFKALFGNDNGDATSVSGDSTGSDAARLNIMRVKISKRTRKLSLLATLAPNATGSARVTLKVGGRKMSFSKRINGGRLKVSRKISSSQARKGTGTVTVTYGGNEQTRPQKVRLRIAPGKPKLRILSGPRINGNQLSAAGTISKRARGSVRIQLNFFVAGKSITREFRATISKGSWSLNAALPASVAAELVQRTGSAQSYAIFNGSRRVAGAMKLYDVLGSR